ncbi:unnamed protein product [Paramecium sonneborni]|uniref:Uncharacterized protein n=1 Tax=Paramecium sonneborni TaxID=65129 RepID=A0A8S1MFU3_9CILI|nr:unnamed protein product [Paramecium sonneborni]
MAELQCTIICEELNKKFRVTLDYTKTPLDLMNEFQEQVIPNPDPNSQNPNSQNPNYLAFKFNTKTLDAYIPFKQQGVNNNDTIELIIIQKGGLSQ